MDELHTMLLDGETLKLHEDEQITEETIAELTGGKEVDE